MIFLFILCLDDDYKARGTITIPSLKEKDVLIKQDQPLTEGEIASLEVFDDW